MIFFHSSSTSNCIKRALDTVLSEFEREPTTIYYVNGTISDKLFYLVNQSKLAESEQLLRMFNYDKVDDISSLKMFLSELDGDKNSIVIVEGLLQILSSGLSDYTEKNSILVDVMMMLKKFEAQLALRAIILDEFNYFVSLHCTDVIKCT